MVLSRTAKNILAFLGIAALFVLLWYLRALVIYIGIAVILTLIGRPITNTLTSIHIGKYRIPDGLAALLTILLFLGILIGFISIFIPLVFEQVRIIASTDASKMVKSLEEPLMALENWLERYQFTNEVDFDIQGSLKKAFTNFFDFSSIGYLVNSIFGIFGNLFVAFFSVGFIAFFFLKEKRLIHDIIIGSTPDSRVEQVNHIIQNTKQVLTRYFVGLILQVTAVTTVVTTGLSIMGIENALVIGFFAGFINLIPYLGPLIGGTFGAIITISTNLQLDFYSEMVPLILKVLSIFVIVQTLDNLLFQPLIFSNSVKAHPLEIYLVILIGAKFAGIMGMVIAIPTYSFIRIIGKEFFTQFKVVKSLTKDI